MREGPRSEPDTWEYTDTAQLPAETVPRSRGRYSLRGGRRENDTIKLQEFVRPRLRTPGKPAYQLNRLS